LLESPKIDGVVLDDSGIESVKDESSVISSSNSVITDESEITAKLDKNGLNTVTKIIQSETLPSATPVNTITIEAEKPDQSETISNLDNLKFEELTLNDQPKLEKPEPVESELTIPENEVYPEHTYTPLEEEWKFCFNHKPTCNIKKDASMPRRMSISPEMEEVVYDVASFDSIESFWKIANHLYVPTRIHHKTRANLYLFKSTSHPTWEHHSNIGGCQWVCVIPKEKRLEVLNSLWFELVFACIGNTFPEHTTPFINGIAVQRRQKEDRITLWAKDFSNKNIQLDIGRHMKQVLGVNKHACLTCTRFDAQNTKPITKNSSFQYRSSNQESYIV